MIGWFCLRDTDTLSVEVNLFSLSNFRAFDKLKFASDTSLKGLFGPNDQVNFTA